MSQQEVQRLQALAIKSKNQQLRNRYQRQANAERLRDQIKSCTDCDLYMKRKKAVPWTGGVNKEPQIVLVGEAPGASENREGIPFIGNSGRVLTSILRLHGLERDDVAIMNTLCCRPPKNADPTPEQMEACRPNFLDQLDLVGGWVGVCLGGYAAAGVFGLERSSVRIRDYEETVTWALGHAWVVTYHPATVLYADTREKSEEREKHIVRAIQTALAIRHSDVMAPSPDYPQIRVLDRDYRGLGKVIEENGWALVNAERIGLGTMVLVVDETREQKPIPKQIAGLTRYTVNELLMLGLAEREGRTKKNPYRWSREDLARLHYVKTEFDAMVVG